MREGQPIKLEGVPARPVESENEGIPRVPPKWLKHDKATLRFYAYFQEPVHESKVENFRVRKCIIYYYMEDDTLHIIEPRIENSVIFIIIIYYQGIPQGVFLKRHKVPKDDTPTSDYITFMDLNIGWNFTVYGRVFRIVKCDEFTRRFY